MAAGHTEVHVRTTDDRFAQEIKAGHHTFTADEPSEVGGGDTGPDPYELLLASLGACTSMTIRMYAQRKNWPVASVAVHLSHRKIHARDCESCDQSKSAYVDRIEKTITIEGDDLSDEQRKRLLEIADRCPVHRTLLGEIEIASGTGSADD